jgi:hypothetical protein
MLYRAKMAACCEIVRITQTHDFFIHKAGGTYADLPGQQVTMDTAPDCYKHLRVFVRFTPPERGSSWSNSPVFSEEIRFF